MGIRTDISFPILERTQHAIDFGTGIDQFLVVRVGYKEMSSSPLAKFPVSKVTMSAMADQNYAHIYDRASEKAELVAQGRTKKVSCCLDMPTVKSICETSRLLHVYLTNRHQNTSKSRNAIKVESERRDALRPLSFAANRVATKSSNEFWRHLYSLTRSSNVVKRLYEGRKSCQNPTNPRTARTPSLHFVMQPGLRG